LTSTKSNKDDKNLNLKDVKPVDGFEVEWKQGKLRPADQKSYRSKLDEYKNFNLIEAPAFFCL
jgi:hypothetical protein